MSLTILEILKQSNEINNKTYEDKEKIINKKKQKEKKLQDTTNSFTYENFLPSTIRTKPAILTRSGLYIPFSSFNNYLSDEHAITLDKLKNKFSIKTKTIGNNFVSTIQASINYDKKYIKLPRYITPLIMNKKYHLQNAYIDNQISKGENPKTPFVWSSELRNNQPTVVKFILNHIYNKIMVKNGRSGLILNLEAGQGKTYVAIYLMSIIQRKTLVICHNTTILNQWKKVISEIYPSNTIGEYYDKQKTDGDIILMLIQSANKPNYTFINSTTNSTNNLTKKITLTSLDYYRRFGFVIYDECHEYCSGKRQNIFKKAQAIFTLGLSATPNERGDKFDPVSWWHIGPVLDARNIPNYTVEDISFKGYVRKIEYMGPPEYTKTVMNKSIDVVSVVSSINQIVEDPYRLKLIIYEAMRLLKLDNLNVFIFADRLNYLEKIQNQLVIHDVKNKIITTDEELDSLTNKYHKITGGASEKSMQNAEAYARIILTTYQYMGTGKSIPKMNSIILSTPRKSKSKQFINRIFRLGSNYDIERTIVDIVDWNTILKQQFYMRKKHYDEKKYPIKKVRVDYKIFESDENKIIV